jgi:serine/threonine-protein kinase
LCDNGRHIDASEIGEKQEIDIHAPSICMLNQARLKGMEDLTGKQLGQYTIVAPLGEGGMAAVYKAYQKVMDRYVALKILPRHFAADPEFVGRFEQEAKIIARLQHVHILPVHDYGTAEGYTYIVMPFVETGTLGDLLQGEPLPLDQIRKITTQVSRALQHAHSQGMVHRDVKPTNILIDQDGNCLLTDFGITKVVEGTTGAGSGSFGRRPSYDRHRAQVTI